MVITVDLASGTVALADADDFTRFHLEARGEGDLAGALAEAGAGRVDGDNAFVDAAWLQASGPGSPEWTEGFTKMVGYAQSKGWLDASGAIQAHVERH